MVTPLIFSDAILIFADAIVLPFKLSSHVAPLVSISIPLSGVVMLLPLKSMPIKL